MTAVLAAPRLDADLGDALAAGLLGPVPADLPAFERAFVDLVDVAPTRVKTPG